MPTRVNPHQARLLQARSLNGTKPSGDLATPFVKWAGGKGQLLDSLLDSAPESFSQYHEAFVGGGAFFFALAGTGSMHAAVLNDLNRELMTTYEVIKDDVEALIMALSRIERGYKGSPSESDFYYALRRWHPSSRIHIAARFIFLNKTCYNGLYRVNQKGAFNVPFGRYAKPSIYSPTNLRSVQKALQCAKILSQPFADALQNVKNGDFVYLDPPYQPVSPTANFTGYTPLRFTLLDQKLLAAEFRRLHELGAYVMLSNSDHEAIERLYASREYNIIEVKANRQINCNASKRGPVCELIVRNYA